MISECARPRAQQLCQRRGRRRFQPASSAGSLRPGTGALRIPKTPQPRPRSAPVLAEVPFDGEAEFPTAAFVVLRRALGSVPRRFQTGAHDVVAAIAGDPVARDALPVFVVAGAGFARL